ncbi:MAG TPA: phage infection protein, partial [Candidatus Dormibacteraeota bacterium]|nr:phage infection protein [Candidatus Dormibacteraeota bacterium]
AVLSESDVRASLDAYISKYNELIAASTYFRKGIFEYYNATTIAKNLEDQGFFKAKHLVTLSGSETKVEVKSRKQLEEIIAAEREGITDNPALRSRFDNLDKVLLRNQSLKAFRSYVLNNEAILSQLANVGKFKVEVWKSYLKKHVRLYEEVMRKREDAEQRSKDILEQARREHTQWEQVIDLFNDRFVVPFKLSVKNRDAVVVGNADPVLAFTCEDDGETASMGRSQLLDMLSQGEKKALYILDILFDVQVRVQREQETLFIIDDIADSFDYRNKYAIIQYLMDLARKPEFKLIILTHNFDFFRTACLRFVGYSGCLMATRNSSGLSIDKASGIKNPFVNQWKDRFFDDGKKRIASISFIRNLIEYTEGDDGPDYATLTALVHSKPTSSSVLQSELDAIYNRLFSRNGAAYPSPTNRVVDDIHAEANDCLAAGASANLEHKIVLSIAIRLAAESFMIAKINDSAFVQSIAENQTQKLLEKYEEMFTGGGGGAIQVLRRVALMVPENIHLNAFMYEPIVDMSDEHLRKLYQDVLALSSGP